MHNHINSNIDPFPANMSINPIRQPHLYLVMDDVNEK